MQIKITKDGKSQTIIASLENAKELFPESDGNTHEVVDETPSARIVKAEKELEGRMWRDDELFKTDALIVLPDHPDKDNFTTYRQELRDWPSTGDFPDTRPTLGS